MYSPTTAEASEKLTRRSYSTASDVSEDREIRIHEWLTYEQIEEIRSYMENYPGKRLNSDEMYDMFKRFGIVVTTEEFKTLFLKINEDRDNLCDWNELCSYLIYLFQKDDPFSQKEALKLPISGDPVVKISKHKTAIVSITALESLEEDDDEEAKGTYLTASKDGLVNFWSNDFEVIRKGMSKSQYLRVTPTWVLGIIGLSDVRIICVSSTERELRFYDVMATNFNLRMVVRSVPYAVCAMSYSYMTNGESNSKLVLGDLRGNVRILEFTPVLRGPFQSKAGSGLIELTWNEVIKGKFPLLKVKEHCNVFVECIQQVYFSNKFDNLYIAAEFHGGGFQSTSGGIISFDSRDTRSLFSIPKGVTSFFIDERSRIMATGGPDAFLRLWDAFIPSKASAILSGHHAGICYIFIQPEEKKIYSVDVAKIIKVWHLFEQNLLQTFSDLIYLVPQESQICYMYNKFDRELLVGGRKLVAIKCCPKMKLDLTDGNTHAGPVSVVLYNKLFNNIVTCGLDSYIIVWDPWTGKRMLILKKCHTLRQYGEIIDMPITAGCFGYPLEQLLLTGARDGSLKIWNYNSGDCIRNMKIEFGCEVTAVFWVTDRILACGWNHHVTEFADSIGQEYLSDAKNWVELHDEDITAAAYRPGETLVTGTYSGELIFWKIETGQPYRKYEVEKPKEFIKLVLEKKATKLPHAPRQSKKAIRISQLMRKSVSRKLAERFKQLEQLQREQENLDEHTVFDEAISLSQIQLSKSQQSQISIGSNLSHSIIRELSKDKDKSKSISTVSLSQSEDSKSIIKLPRIQRRVTGPIKMYQDNVVSLRLSVQAIIMLNSRPTSKEHGTVLVALENGVIQVYSHHQLGGYITEFYTIHKTGDCVMAMTTDRKNKYLFTGTAFGYIKIWLIQNYCKPKSEHTHVSMPKLRFQFIFLRKDRIPGRAKRVASNQSPEPMLLSSFKGHIRSISSINYIEQPRIIVTGSSDYSCRFWSLGGRYLGTLGGLVPWQKLSPTQRINEDDDYRIPPDINKVASSTTLKVITGKFVDPIRKFSTAMDETAGIDKHIKDKPGFAKTIREPLLGKHFKLENSGRISNPPILDKTLPYIPVWDHLAVHQAKPIGRPSTPEVLKKTKNLEFAQYYNAKNN